MRKVELGAERHVWDIFSQGRQKVILSQNQKLDIFVPDGINSVGDYNSPRVGVVVVVVVVVCPPF